MREMWIRRPREARAAYTVRMRNRAYFILFLVLIIIAAYAIWLWVQRGNPPQDTGAAPMTEERKEELFKATQSASTSHPQIAADEKAKLYQATQQGVVSGNTKASTTVSSPQNTVSDDEKARLFRATH